MTLVKIYLITITITISNNFFSCFMFFTQNSPSWIRIRILNTDPDPGGKMNADPDPQPWFPSKKICSLHTVAYIYVADTAFCVSFGGGNGLRMCIVQTFGCRQESADDSLHNFFYGSMQ